MLFEEEKLVYKQPSSVLNFEGNSEIYNFHQSLKHKSIPHGVLLPIIYSSFPELLDDLVLSLSHNQIDKFELKQNENGNILMENLLECVSFAQKTSFIGNKIIIIHGVCELSLNVANALLKILEEPPKDTMFLLIYKAKNAVLPTIASRSLLINFKNSKDNFDFIVNNFINSAIPINKIEAITGSQIHLISLFKNSETQNIIEDFNSLIGNFNYLQFKSFFLKYNKLNFFVDLIYLLIEYKIKMISQAKIVNLRKRFMYYKKYINIYNTNFELFLYYIVNKICELN